MDVHVPSAITAGLRRRGIDVITSQDDGSSESDDDVLLARATELDRLFFTQDEDFLKLAPQWQESGRRFSGVIFARQMATSLGLLIDELELLMLCATEEELNNRVIHLPLR